jgi:hypothetical protein
MWDFVSKGKLMLSFDRWGDGRKSGVHSQASAAHILKQSGHLFPYALHDGRASYDFGAERVEDVRAPNMRPVGSSRQAYQTSNCTLIQNGYGDLRRRRLYIGLIRIHACTELRRCKRSGVLRDAASSRSECPHIYSATQSASATA